MPEGTIKKLAEKGFGFISSNGGDVFFHMSELVDVQFNELHVGQTVGFEMGEGPKGPRAEKVRVV
jgi:CspA family cold shock protein